MFKETVLRAYWVLGVAVVVSYFAAVEAEAQGYREGPKDQCPGCECCCQSDHRGFSVPSVVSTVLLPPAPVGGERLWGRR